MSGDVETTRRHASNADVEHIGTPPSGWGNALAALRATVELAREAMAAQGKKIDDLARSMMELRQELESYKVQQLERFYESKLHEQAWRSRLLFMIGGLAGGGGVATMIMKLLGG